MEKSKDILTDTWYKETVDFIQEFNQRKLPKNARAGETVSPIKRIQIHDNIPKIPILRVYDTFIMSDFIKADIPKKDLKILNIMRMYLKAFSLADIATSDGKSITYNAWHLKSSNELRVNYDWPRDPPNFSEKQKNTRISALKKAYCNQNANQNEERKLQL